MKKLYSIVLMATALLIGTNAWAETRPANDAESFEAAWRAAQNNDIIQLTNDVEVGKTFWLGTQTMNDAANVRSLTLDLNGWTLSVPEASTLCRVFVVTHGELNVVTSQPGGQIIHNGASLDSKYEVIRLQGSTYKNINPKNESEGFYTHLMIGAGVKITAKANAVTIDETNDWSVIPSTNYVGAGNITLPSTKYKTRVYNGKGVANGVRVDVYGHLFGNKYAFKANGNLGSPSTAAASDVASYWEDPAQTKAYSIKAADVNYSPFIRIYGTAKLETPAVKAAVGAKEAVALYSSGYARYLIEGTCEGSTAVYVKSGELDINDATIVSNYQDDYKPSAAAGGSGVTGAGSAIVIESNAAYAGDIDVTISGDTKVEADHGYAIEEKVTSSDTTKVTAITIEGGTFEGGNLAPAGETPVYGTMTVSETTAVAAADPDEITTITIIGGEATGNGSTTVGNETLAQYLNEQGGTHVTYVENEEGKPVMVISEGAAPTPAETKTSWENIAGFTAGSNANWTGTGDTDGVGTIANGETVTLGELQILAATASAKQELTIQTGGALIVDRLLMNKYAKIIVEAGATFIVTGNQGISDQSADNIVLNTSEAAPATFLFAPTVNSNRHPNATVKLLAKEIGYETFNATNYWYWNRFALPIMQATSWSKSPNVTSYIYKWSYEDDDWKSISALTDMVPFQGYILTADQSTLGNVEYTFTGELAGGNENSTLQFARNGFHFFGNSYTGHISVDKLVEQIMGASDIDGTVWVWGDDQQYHAVPLMALRNNPAAFPLAYQKEIAPMQTFVLKHNVNATGATELDYATAVWGNPRYNSFKGMSPAPRRQVADQTTHMNIVITAENGKSDYVVFMEDGMYSDEYENGFDGAKYMNENALNMFASVNGANYSVVATDNVEGKMLTINTVNDVNYTMTFANINGEEYAVRDNVTGAVFAIEEGASYEFAAQPNSVVEGRFEIVSVRKVTTALENAEVNADAKGIYTIMGQYVGEDFNALPAGIYVVNGVKIVK